MHDLESPVAVLKELEDSESNCSEENHVEKYVQNIGGGEVAVVGDRCTA